MIDAEELRYRALETQGMLVEMEYLQTPASLEQAKLYNELGYGRGSTQIQENKVWILKSWQVECDDTIYGIFSSPEKAMDYTGIHDSLWTLTNEASLLSYDHRLHKESGFTIRETSLDPTPNEAFRKN